MTISAFIDFSLIGFLSNEYTPTGNVQDKIKLNKQLPYLVGNIIEVLDLGCEEDEEVGMAQDVDAQR